MTTCKNPTCTINNGICGTHHQCFTCGAYFHVMCSYTITIKEDGEEWDSLQYPGNCIDCNKDKKNWCISRKVLKERNEDDFDNTESNVAKQLVRETKETMFSPRRTRSERKKLKKMIQKKIKNC